MARQASGQPGQLREKILLPAVVALVTSLIISFTTGVVIWLWQQDQLQQWSSRVVADVGFTPDKALTIENRGAVDIIDVQVFLTEYVIGLDIREGGHVYATGKISNFSKVGNVLKSWDRLASNRSLRYELTSNPDLKKLGVIF